MPPALDPALHRRGLAITAAGGLALTVDIPLIRAAGGEFWSIVAVRCLGTFTAAILAWVAIRLLTGRRLTLVPGRAGLVICLFYSVNMLTFMLSVFNTTTANVVFILAFTSMFAALLSWVFLGERPSNATLLTMAVMVAGVAIIVQDGLASGNFFGDAMAACSALLLAASLTMSRRSGAGMGFVPLVSAFLPGLIAFALLPEGGLAIENPVYIVLNGFVMMPFAFWCLATGPRYLSAPEVGMFYLLETVLAPIWVWIAFSETPTVPTLIGGTILILALAAHSLWQMRAKARAALAAAGQDVL